MADDEVTTQLHYSKDVESSQEIWLRNSRCSLNLGLNDVSGHGSGRGDIGICKLQAYD